MKHMLFRENEFSGFSKGTIYTVLVFAFISAVVNLYQGTAVTPEAFTLIIIGFVLFFAAKLAIILSSNLVSFGTKAMSTLGANIYRLGYWFMTVGFLFTFAGKI
jgi:hypothetical protein